jgi:hypothetical protein
MKTKTKKRRVRILIAKESPFDLVEVKGFKIFVPTGPLPFSFVKLRCLKSQTSGQ